MTESAAAGALWLAARGGSAEARAQLGALAREVALETLRARRVERELVEDLAQESVRSTLAALASGAPPPTEIRAFLKWRALGVLSTHRRRMRARAPNAPLDGAPHPTVEGPAPVELALGEELRAALARCRARLTPDGRRVLELRYDRQLDAAAIARELGVTRNAVHVRTFRALAAMRECLLRSGVAPEDLA